MTTVTLEVRTGGYAGTTMTSTDNNDRPLLRRTFRSGFVTMRRAGVLRSFCAATSAQQPPALATSPPATLASSPRPAGVSKNPP
ncbi:hypothetical protein J6590_013141 [Homalodisca vitripennis]|nr:hypothetical protein J6590_013141 [Homalodisca vitripennis]